eukprot:4468952-Prymnesium_polylepis.1
MCIRDRSRHQRSRMRWRQQHGTPRVRAQGGACVRVSVRAAHARRRQCEDFFQHYFTEHIDKSIYWDQLRRLAGVFPREQIFVASLERFVADSTGVFRKLLRFLALPEFGPHGFASEDAMRAVLAQRYNANGAKAPIADASLRRLGRFFAPHNRKLDTWLATTAPPANTAFELWDDW